MQTDVHDSYEYSPRYHGTVCGTRSVCDAGTSFRVVHASSCSSLHIGSLARDWLFVDFTYRSIPFLLSCMSSFHMRGCVLPLRACEALGDLKSGVVVCTDVVLLQKVVRF
jgi:hypothetical protein